MVFTDSQVDIKNPTRKFKYWWSDGGFQHVLRLRAFGLVIAFGRMNRSTRNRHTARLDTADFPGHNSKTSRKPFGSCSNIVRDFLKTTAGTGLLGPRLCV